MEIRKYAGLKTVIIITKIAKKSSNPNFFAILYNMHSEPQEKTAFIKRNDSMPTGTV
jgi:hypothetical protein